MIDIIFLIILERIFQGNFDVIFLYPNIETKWDDEKILNLGGR